MTFRAGQTIGIDLGTTYSAVAQLNQSGVPCSLKNSVGKFSTPSIVYLGPGGKIVVGEAAQGLVDSDPKNLVIAVKREMGSNSFFKVYEHKKLTAEFLSGLILKKLKQDAERHVGPVANAVITVPYYFNDRCRKATQDAGAIAGLNVVDIINEPTAATLAYAWMRGDMGRGRPDKKERTIIVYDLGGGTFDVTLVRYTATDFRVIATDGDSRLGGLDWTARLADHVAEQFERKHGCNPKEDAASFLELTETCEAAKRLLSEESLVKIGVRHANKMIHFPVSLKEFEQLTSDLLQRTRDTTELVLQHGLVGLGQLDAVLLVGGATHMPAVERMLRELTGKKPSRDLDPELAVAQGAAIHAAILESREKSGRGDIAEAVLKRLRAVRIKDVNSHSLGVEITDLKNPNVKRNHIMIPRNTPIPHQHSQRFVTNLDNPQAVYLRVLEGEVSDVDACEVLGDFRIVGLPPNLPAGSPVELTYQFESNGRVRAFARELTGNNLATVEIDRSGGLSNAGTEAFKTLAGSYHVE